MARIKRNKNKIFTPSLHRCFKVAGEHLFSQTVRGTIGVRCYICYLMASNPDLKTRSPLKSYNLILFSDGTKENDKKRGITIPQILKGTSCPVREFILANLCLVNFLFQRPRAARSCWTLASQTMVSTKFFLTIPKCSTCTAISPAAEEVILKKTLPYYARPHLKTYALKEEKCSFPSASFGAILSRLSKVIMDIFYFALLFCVIGPQILRHFFNQSDSKLNQSRFDHFCSPTPSMFCLFS